MLNKALIMSPKEFRVSIGTQSNCTASVSKQSAMPGDVVTVTVRATTGHGNTQVGVSPSVSVSKVNETTFTFVMPFTDVVVSASASALDFRINVSQTGSGTVNVKPIAKYGERVTVSVSAANLYELKSISASGVSLSGGGNTWTFTMPANDVRIDVRFDKIIVYMKVGFDGYEQFGYYEGEYGELNHVPCWGNDRLIGFYGWRHYDSQGNNPYLISLKTRAYIKKITMVSENGRNSREFIVSSFESQNTSDYNFIKQQVHTTVKLIFDPPPTGFL